MRAKVQRKVQPLQVQQAQALSAKYKRKVVVIKKKITA